MWLYTYLLQVLKEEPLSSAFSTNGTLISASAAPHCGGLSLYQSHDQTRIPSTDSACHTILKQTAFRLVHHASLDRPSFCSTSSTHKGSQRNIDSLGMWHSLTESKATDPQGSELPDISRQLRIHIGLQKHTSSNCQWKSDSLFVKHVTL